MENHPRKAGFSPAGGRSIRPTSITDASVRLKRLEASTSQQSVTTLVDTLQALEEQQRRQNNIATTSSEKGELSEGTDVEEVEKWQQEQKWKRKWNPGVMAAVAAMGAIGGIAAGMYSIRPRDPIFHVELITLKGFDLRFCTDSPLLLAVVDVSLVLHINVTNPNVAPIVFSDTIMDIYYRSTLLGQAKVQSGDQAAKSSKVMELPAKLDGLELTNHIKDLFCDVAKREMTLHSVVTISGDSLLWRWRHHFKIYVNSEIKVDPIFLNVLDQQTKAHLEMAPIM